VDTPAFKKRDTKILDGASSCSCINMASNNNADSSFLDCHFCNIKSPSDRCHPTTTTTGTPDNCSTDFETTLNLQGLRPTPTQVLASFEDIDPQSGTSSPNTSISSWNEDDGRPEHISSTFRTVDDLLDSLKLVYMRYNGMLVNSETITARLYETMNEKHVNMGIALPFCFLEEDVNVGKTDCGGPLSLRLDTFADCEPNGLINRKCKIEKKKSKKTTLFQFHHYGEANRSPLSLKAVENMASGNHGMLTRWRYR